MDISKPKFHQFQFLRSGFVLHRFSPFRFRLFITHIEATTDIDGAVK
ncbi:DUF3289 family protein [Erwinia billingiae]|nr:DUF3289 family protein [Erwinia billingiae]